MCSLFAMDDTTLAKSSLVHSSALLTEWLNSFILIFFLADVHLSFCRAAKKEKMTLFSINHLLLQIFFLCYLIN